MFTLGGFAESHATWRDQDSFRKHQNDGIGVCKVILLCNDQASFAIVVCNVGALKRVYHLRQESPVIAHDGLWKHIEVEGAWSVPMLSLRPNKG